MMNTEKLFDESSAYPKVDWQGEVAADRTQLGYRDWVIAQAGLPPAVAPEPKGTGEVSQKMVPANLISRVVLHGLKSDYRSRLAACIRLRGLSGAEAECEMLLDTANEIATAHNVLVDAVGFDVVLPLPASNLERALTYVGQLIGAQPVTAAAESIRDQIRAERKKKPLDPDTAVAVSDIPAGNFFKHGNNVCFRIRLPLGVDDKFPPGLIRAVTETGHLLRFDPDPMVYPATPIDFATAVVKHERSRP